MEYVKTYEGWKSWIATFSILLSLGTITPSRAQKMPEQQKISLSNSISNNLLSFMSHVQKKNVDTLYNLKKECKIQNINFSNFIKHLESPTSTIKINYFTGTNEPIIPKKNDDLKSVPMVLELNPESLKKIKFKFSIGDLRDPKKSYLDFGVKYDLP